MAAVKDAVVIGAGPAGVAAAIYLHRAGADVTLIEKGAVGGLIRNANLVENYPGFPEGISGPALADLFADQLDRLGVDVIKAHVTKVRRKDDSLSVTAGKRVIRARTVVVGTGTRPKRLGIRGEERLEGKRLFYTIAEMPLTKAMDVVIIGGGDAAFDYALNLHARGCRAAIVSRSEPKCLGLLRDRAEEAGIPVVLGLEAVSVEERAGKAVLTCRGEEGESDFMGNLILAAVGREPELDLFDGPLRSKLKLKNGGPETNVPGLYLAGDVVRGSRRQTGIAVGDGIRAAMAIHESIKKRVSG